jgi:ribosomal protein L7/L12
MAANFRSSPRAIAEYRTRGRANSCPASFFNRDQFPDDHVRGGCLIAPPWTRPASYVVNRSTAAKQEIVMTTNTSRSPSYGGSKVEKARSRLVYLSTEMQYYKRELGKQLREIARRVEELSSKRLTDRDLEEFAVFVDAAKKIRTFSSDLSNDLVKANAAVNRPAYAGGDCTVVLVSFGRGPAQVAFITHTVAQAGISPEEAEELVAHLPVPILVGVSATAAAEIKANLERVGATVEIKQLAAC